MIYIYMTINVTFTYLTEQGNCLYSAVSEIMSYSLCSCILKPITLAKSIKLFFCLKNMFCKTKCALMMYLKKYYYVLFKTNW